MEQLGPLIPVSSQLCFSSFSCVTYALMPFYRQGTVLCRYCVSSLFCAWVPAIERELFWLSMTYSCSLDGGTPQLICLRPCLPVQ